MQNQPTHGRFWIEEMLGISLTDADFADSAHTDNAPESRDVFRAAIRHSAPWLDSVSNDEQQTVLTLMSAFLELEARQGLDQSVDLGVETAPMPDLIPKELSQPWAAHLLGVWQSYFWLNRDLPGMTAYAVTLMRHGRVIYHILPRADWSEAQTAGVYTPPSLATEGFIHCSNIDQVTRSANAYFKGQTDLLVISIAAESVRAEIRDEDLLGAGMDFPHIYGPLNLDAVFNDTALAQGEDENFHLPQGLFGL